MIPKTSLKEIAADRTLLFQEEAFVYVLPREPLRNLISNFTMTFPDECLISDEYTIMPHGSVTLVLFHHHDELHSFLFGPATQPQKVGNLANQCGMIFIIEFQPAGFYPWSQIHQKELTDRIVPFSWIDRELDETLRRIFSSSVSAEDLLRETEKELLQKIRFPYPKELAAALQVIVQSGGIMTMEDVSTHLFYSSRQLNRLADHYLGMNLKSFSRLVRINKALRLLNESTNSLTSVCEQLGYYDASHLVRDFRIVCGVTPGHYRAHMSDFYNEIAKF